MANTNKQQITIYFGTPQKTAWFMLQRIRQAAGKEQDNDKDDGNLLAGIVEIDETSIGGRRRINIRANGQKGHKDGAQRPSLLRLASRNGRGNAVHLPPQP